MDRTKIINLVFGAASLAAVFLGLDQRQKLKFSHGENVQLRQELNKLRVDQSNSQNHFRQVSLKSSPEKRTEIKEFQGDASKAEPGKQNELAAIEKRVQAIGAKINKLNQKLEQSPELNIPELQLLNENEWIKVTLDSEMLTDDDLREALSKLRDKAVNTFFDEALRPAFQRYLDVHNNVMPEEIGELRPYLKVGIDDSVFDRYQLGQKGGVSSDPGKALVTLKSHVDEDYHSEHHMTINGSFGGRINRVEGMVEEAAKTFVQKNNGAIPQSPDEITPYLLKELPKETVQKYLAKLLQQKGR